MSILVFRTRVGKLRFVVAAHMSWVHRCLVKVSYMHFAIIIMRFYCNFLTACVYVCNREHNSVWEASSDEHHADENDDDDDDLHHHLFSLPSSKNIIWYSRIQIWNEWEDGGMVEGEDSFHLCNLYAISPFLIAWFFPTLPGEQRLEEAPIRNCKRSSFSACVFWYIQMMISGEASGERSRSNIYVPKESRNHFPSFLFLLRCHVAIATIITTVVINIWFLCCYFWLLHQKCIRRRIFLNAKNGVYIYACTWMRISWCLYLAQVHPSWKCKKV